MPPVQLLIKPSSGNCNLRCRYCFYYDEMGRRETASYGFMSLETLENLVHKSMDYAEGSCDFAFQGGEPTLFDDLPPFLRKLKSMGYAVKLDTNGTRPEMLKELIQKKLVDFIAMDLKAPLEKYVLLVHGPCKLLAVLRQMKHPILLLHHQLSLPQRLHGAGDAGLGDLQLLRHIDGMYLSHLHLQAIDGLQVVLQ